MDNKIGLAAAFVALMLAAGIESSSATENVTDAELILQRIETSTSIPSLQKELDDLRVADPTSPYIAAIMRRIVYLSRRGAPRVVLNIPDNTLPY